LCFREQTNEEFYGQTIPLARARSTRVTLDPPYLGGDRLEIESRRAAFRDLTLGVDRLDLLAAALEGMTRCHQTALRNLGAEAGQRKPFLTGGDPERFRALLPEAMADVRSVPDSSLCGVARLFSQPEQS